MCGLRVTFEDLFNVVIDVNVDSCKLSYFKRLPDEITRLPLLKGIAVLWVDSEHIRSLIRVGVLTAVAANATITTVTEDTHSSSPST